MSTPKTPQKMPQPYRSLSLKTAIDLKKKTADQTSRKKSGERNSREGSQPDGGLEVQKSWGQLYQPRDHQNEKKGSTGQRGGILSGKGHESGPMSSKNNDLTVKKVAQGKRGTSWRLMEVGYGR